MACAVAWLVPVVVAVIRAVAADWYPVSDQALIAVRARDVLTADHPLLGTAASAALGEGVLTNHPGPLIFDVVALPVRLFGAGAGLVVGIAALNLGAGLVAIVAAYRRGGRGGAVAVTGGMCALVWSAGNAVLVDPYNPTACMVPFLAVLVLAWSAATGDRWALPWLLALATFCVQTNLAYLVTVVPIVIGSLALYVWLRRDQHAGRDLLWRGAPVLLVLWAQPILEQLLHVTDGNVARLARASVELEQPLGWADGTRQAASVLSQWPGWARGSFDGNYVMNPFVAPPSVWPAVLSLLVLIAVLVALACVAARWLRDRATLTLLGVTAGFVLIGWVATMRVPLSPFYGFLPHFVRWLWPIGVMTIVAVALCVGRALQRLIGGRPVPGAIAVMPLLLTVAFAVPDGPLTLGEAEWSVARPVAKELNRLAVERLPASGVVVDFRPPDYPPFAYSLVAALQEHGTPFTVTDGISARQYGNSRRAPADPIDPVIYVSAGFEALDGWDDAVACASSLDEDDRTRLLDDRARLAAALGAPGFTLSANGAAFAATAFAPPWMASVPDGLDGADGEIDAVVTSVDLVTLLDDGLIVPPASMADVARDFSGLRRRLEETTACVVERAA